MVKRRQSGEGISDILRAAHNLVKQKRIISAGLRHFGHPKLAKVAHQLGYGKKKKRKTRRVGMVGRGFIGKTLGGIGGGLLGGLLPF